MEKEEMDVWGREYKSKSETGEARLKRVQLLHVNRNRYL